MAAVEGEPRLKFYPGCGIFNPAVPEGEFIGGRQHMHMAVAGPFWGGLVGRLCGRWQGGVRFIHR